MAECPKQLINRLTDHKYSYPSTRTEKDTLQLLGSGRVSPLDLHYQSILRNPTHMESNFEVDHYLQILAFNSYVTENACCSNIRVADNPDLLDDLVFYNNSEGRLSAYIGDFSTSTLVCDRRRMCPCTSTENFQNLGYTLAFTKRG